jgi:hypothetical protein
VVIVFMASNITVGQPLCKQFITGGKAKDDGGAFGFVAEKLDKQRTRR